MREGFAQAYPFDIDPAWHLSDNLFLFLDSLKGIPHPPLPQHEVPQTMLPPPTLPPSLPPSLPPPLQMKLSVVLGIIHTT